MSRTWNLLMIVLLVFGVGDLTAGAAPQSGASLTGTELTGSVKSATGKPLEGVAVSARSDTASFTTTVYTDQKGEYFFPPLESGNYKVWAQAVGFGYVKSELAITSGKKVQHQFTLNPLQDFHLQLSSVDWLQSIPETQSGDARMKLIITHSCITCHTSGFALQNRFDVAGWTKILNMMSLQGSKGYVSPDDAPPGTSFAEYPGDVSFLQSFGQIKFYKEELANYLGRVRGPDSPPLQYKLTPRPTGEAAQIVVTEYDLDPEATNSHDGSDWSNGTPSSHGGVHDLAVSPDGKVYWSEPGGGQFTIGRLDPQTGELKHYKLDYGNKLVAGAHGLTFDQNGKIWFNNYTKFELTEFDPTTEQFIQFPRPSSPPLRSLSIDVDSKGNIWSDFTQGADKLDPKTGKYTTYFSSVKNMGGSYGMAVDAKDNAYFTMLYKDRIGVVDPNGKLTEIPLAPVNVDDFITDRDREIGARNGSSNNTSPLYQNGPRREAADKNGDSLWVADFWGNRITKIDINTKKVTNYTYPIPYSHPYAMAVDKNHMVWIDLIDRDAVAEFNPFTEKFTEFPLPSRGIGSRHITVDNRSDIPDVWIPENRLDKAARIQFRTTTVAQK